MSGLPKGWAEAALEDMVASKGVIVDGDWIETKDQDPTGDVRLTQLADIGVAEFRDKSNRFMTSRKAEQLGCTFLKSGDVLIARMPDPLGRACVFPGLPQPAVTVVDVLIWRSGADEIVSEWIVNAINSPATRARITAQAGGTTRQRISGGNLKRLALPLPPLAEQKRIVAKLDALSARSARARTELARVETLVSRYKQAVLDAAFDTANGTVPLESLVDDLRGIPYGIVKTGEPHPNGVPTIRCGDIKNYRIEKKNLKLVHPTTAESYKRTSLRGGEVLIAIRGSIGETCVVSSKLIGANISREVAMIPVSKYLNPQFAMYFLKSKAAIEFIGINTKGSAQRGINLGDLRALPIPTVSIQSQNEIVRRIQTAFVRIDRLATEAERALTLVGKLDEAILAKAFRGELVPQDENDEPASVLLERVLAERAAAPKPKRGRAKG